jgi:protein-L-isoaspartate(D-aspartate) O-methyltransferase
MQPTHLAVFGALLMGVNPLPGPGQPVDPGGQAPHSANERVEERRRMVEAQIAHPRDGRAAVTDSRVLAAMLAVPRHAFVPPEVSDQAYDDTPLPIGHGQTISQPYIVALMTEHLGLPPGGKVLEIGTGSGYQAAVLARLTPNVFTIEIVEDLARMARQTLRDQGDSTVQVRRGDGHLGWPEQAPFDAIIVTCAPESLPLPLWNQLKPGGRIVIPIGPVDRVQRLVVVSKTADGQRRTDTVTDVRFVPMIREPSLPSESSPATSCQSIACDRLAAGH